MSEIDLLVGRIKADASQLERELKRAENATKDTAGRMGGALNNLKSQFAALVPAVSLGALVAFGKNAIDAAGHMNDLAGRIGFAATTLAALEAPLAATGSSLDDLSASVNLMNNQIGEAAKGGQESVKAFDQLGLSVRKLQELSPEEQFYEIVDALAKVDSQARQTEAGRAIFGRGFAALIPLIKESNGALRELVEVQKEATPSKEALDRLDAFGDAMSNAYIKAKNAAIEALAAMLKVNEQLLQLSAGSAQGGFAVGKLGAPLGGGGEAFGPAMPKGTVSTTRPDTVSVATFLTKTAAKGSNAGLIKSSGDAAKEAAEDYDKAGDALNDYLARLQQEGELAGLSGKALEERRAILEANAVAMKENALLSPEMQAQIVAEVDATYDLKEAQDKLKKSQEEAAETAREWRKELTDGLTDAILHFDSARDAAKRFFEEIASQILKKQVTGPLSDSIMNGIGGTGLFSSIFGGGSAGVSSTGLQVGKAYDTSSLFSGLGSMLGFADGGNPPVGVPSIVGERGPEIFVPKTAGTVLPNGVGMGVTVVQNINISPGVPELITAKIREAAPLIASMGKNMVFSAIQGGGAESRMVGKRA